MPIFIKKDKKEENKEVDQSLESFSNVEEEIIKDDKIDTRGNMEMFEVADNLNEVRTQNNFSDVETNMDNPNFSDVATTITNEKGEEYTFVDNTGKTGEDIKNPIYNGKNAFQDRQVSGNVLACLFIFFEVFFSPGLSIIKNTKKYVNGKKSIKVFIHIMVFLVVFSLIGRVVAGCFVKKYVASSRDIVTVLDFGNFSNLNFFNIILLSFIFSLGIVIVVTLVNYLTSFFSSKGLSFDTYLLMNSLSIIPLTMGINVVYPLLSVISVHIGFIAFILCLIYTLLVYINAINSIMEFSSDNRRVFYLLFNFAIMIIGTYALLYFFFENNINDLFEAFKNALKQ